MPFAKLIYQYPIIFIALFLELECGAFEDERACPADLQKVKGIKNQSSYMKNCTKSLVFQMCDCLFRYSKISLEQLRFVLIYKENLLLCMLIRKCFLWIAPTIINYKHKLLFMQMSFLRAFDYLDQRWAT